MPSLTIEELKALQVGDWVWVIGIEHKFNEYAQIKYNSQEKWVDGTYEYLYFNYGKTWVAYKNKEQSENLVPIEKEVKLTAKDRLIVEIIDLQEKLRKLIKFSNSKAFYELGEEHRNLLCLQSYSMKEYLNILQRRLKIWDR